MYKEILRKCATSISTATGNKIFFDFSTDQEVKGLREFIATFKISLETSTFHDGKCDWIIMPLFEKDSDLYLKYWLGLRIHFKYEAKEHILYHLSMIILRYEEEMRPLFRVEWQADGENKKHAQPHWHVYDYIQQDFGVPNSFHVNMVEGDTAKIHFAMVSQWHLGITNEEGHFCALEKDIVINWLTGCINYIKGQLQYYESKVPPSNTDRKNRVGGDVQDFE